MIKKLATTASLALMTSLPVTAAPIILDGDFVRTAVSDDGTLGFGGNTPPGILHDPSGTNDFSLNDDYLTPGSPFEAFSVQSDQTSLVANNNAAGDTITQTGIADASGTNFDNEVRWDGTLAGFFDIAHIVGFDDGQERINITTMITALTDLTNVLFARALDPDPDVNRFGSFSTENQRGLDANNDGDLADSGDAALEDFVGATGSNSGQTIGLFSDSAVAHDTNISFSCCTEIDPDFYLFDPKNNSTTGDDGIGMGFNLGNLNSGDSTSFSYSYVMGGTLETVDTGTGGSTPSVPEPGSLALLAAALLGLGGARRLKS